jgi:hypothetical protein
LTLAVNVRFRSKHADSLFDFLSLSRRWGTLQIVRVRVEGLLWHLQSIVRNTKVVQQQHCLR